MLLAQAIDQASTGALRRAAEAHGLAVDDASTRAEMAQRLLERLSDAQYLGDRLGSLADTERSVLLAAAEAGGEVRGFLVGRLLGLAANEPPRSLLEPLFLVRTFSPTGPHRGEIYALPDEIRALLPIDLPADADDQRAGTIEPPERADRRTSDPAFSAFALASLLQRQEHDPPELSAGARTAQLRSEVAAWSEEPGGWEWQERWAFLRHLMESAGLLRPHDGQLAPSESLYELLNDRAHLRQRLFSAYLRDRAWPDLEHAGVPRADELQVQLDLPALRDALVRQVGRLVPDGWARLPDLDAAVRRAAPTVLREQLDARGAALLDPESGNLLLAEGSWPRVEGRLLRYVLLGPLYWLGLLATDLNGERVSLTGNGRALLDEGSAGAEPPRPPEPITWSGLELTASARAALGTLLQAEPYLEPRRRGPVSHYGLSLQSLGDGLLSGGSVQAAQALLATLSGGLLPEQVAEQLGRCAEEFGRLALRPAVLLEARDQAGLDAALDLPAVRHRVRQRLGPQAAELAGAELNEVVAALHRAGHLPRVDAALNLMAGRRAYQSLVDQQVLELLLACLLAIQHAAPDEMAQLEGATALLRRLERVFPPERTSQLRQRGLELARALSGATGTSQYTRLSPGRGGRQTRVGRRGRRDVG